MMQARVFFSTSLRHAAKLRSKHLCRKPNAFLCARANSASIGKYFSNRVRLLYEGQKKLLVSRTALPEPTRKSKDRQSAENKVWGTETYAIAALLTEIRQRVKEDLGVCPPARTATTTSPLP